MDKKADFGGWNMILMMIIALIVIIIGAVAIYFYIKEGKGITDWFNDIL